MEKNKFAREARENFGKKQVPARSAGKIWGIFSFPWILGAKLYIKNTKIGSRAARRKFWQKIGSRVKIGGNFGKKQVRARSARNLKMEKIGSQGFLAAPVLKGPAHFVPHSDFFSNGKKIWLLMKLTFLFFKIGSSDFQKRLSKL